MTYLQKKLLDNIINNGMYKYTTIENDFLLFATLVFKHNVTYVLTYYFECSRSKISKLRNGLQSYSQKDLEKLNELFKMYKEYNNEFKHIFDRVM